jgi:hypothetical protein
MRAASDGRTGVHWREDDQDAVCIFEMPALSHYVRLELTANDVSDGQDLSWLRDLRSQQDSDSAFALLYIARQMISAQATPEAPLRNAVIDLDDVIAGIGFDPRSTAQRLVMRRRIWSLIMFGERARIVGQRKGSYLEKTTGKSIETTITTAPWRIMQEERPEQMAFIDEIPVRVELAASNEWMRLLMSPHTAQFLPMGEVLGAIAPFKAAGAWARVIGLSLANLWRRKPREALEGSLRPSRESLLMQYPPSVGNPRTVLNSTDPRHAVRYWATALEILVNCGFLENKGEATLSYKQMSENLPRQEWQHEWFFGTVELWPGKAMGQPLIQIARSLPEPKPQDLKRRKRQRI